MTTTNRATPEWITIPEFLRRHKGLVAKNFVYEAVKDGRIPGLRLSLRWTRKFGQVAK